MEELTTKQDFMMALDKADGKPVFVDFSAVWCGPCKRIGPKFEEFAKTFPNAIFYKVHYLLGKPA